jgi:hypothetical protein
VDLVRRIDRSTGEFLLFALTPPRAATARDRVQQIADATIARLRPLDLDGLILYDIDDEVARNPAERPFPFSPTLDPRTISRTTSRAGQPRSSSTVRSASMRRPTYGHGSAPRTPRA